MDERRIDKGYGNKIYSLKSFGIDFEKDEKVLPLQRFTNEVNKRFFKEMPGWRNW